MWGSDREGGAIKTLITLVLLGKPDCHLCHEMRDVVQRVLSEFQAGLEERDVRESDPDTRGRYRLEIPVLLFEGREVARHRVTEDDLRRRLRELFSDSG